MPENSIRAKALASAPPSQARILVVDDESMMTDLLRRYLVESGYVVSVADDGREALEKLRAQEYDLLITDLRMPNLDGLQLLKAAKDLYPPLAGDLHQRLRRGGDRGGRAQGGG